MHNDQKLRGATVEYFLCSETTPLPYEVDGFRLEDYRPTGIVLPFKEFAGPVEAMVHATFLKSLERKFGVGDALVVRFPAINRITTFVLLSKQAPLLFGNTALRLFEAEGRKDVALQLPKSFIPRSF